MGSVLTVVWLLASMLAHLHGGLPLFAREQLQTQNPSQLNPILAAYQEWCKTDARYCQNNACVQTFQGMTFFYGVPMCAALIVAILGNLRIRHLLQLPLCVMQCYGTILYFLTAWLEDFSSISSDPVSFWGLFVGLNSLWIIIPALLGLQSCCVIYRALGLLPRAPSRSSKDPRKQQ